MFFIFHAVAHCFCQLVPCVCVSISLFGVSTLTQLNSKSQLAKSFFFAAIKQLDFHSCFIENRYRFRNESRIVLVAYQYILHCYIILRPFCLQHTHTHTHCRKVCSFSCKWICFHHGELEEPSELVVVVFFLCIVLACVRAWLAWILLEIVCIFFGHALIWHDITKRRQPATMATMTIKHDRQRDNENSPATKYIYSVLMPVQQVRARWFRSVRAKGKRHGDGIDESQFYLTVLLIFRFQCNMLANVKCVMSEYVDICQGKWANKGKKRGKNSLESGRWNW